VKRPFSIIAFLAVAAGLFCLTSCSKRTGAVQDPTSPSENSSAVSAKITKTIENWNVFLIQGARVGIGHDTIRPDVEKERPVVHVETINGMTVMREGQPTQMTLSCSSVETPEGRLESFESELRMGKMPLRMVGRVRGGKLELEMTPPGANKSVRESVPWPAAGGGPLAVELSLVRKPMTPGERRSIPFLMIDLNQAGVMELSAKQIESTALLNGKSELLRIDTVIRLPDGQKIEGAIWTDRAGETLKTHSKGMDMTTYRTTKAEALKKSDAANVDLITTTMVKVDRRLEDARHTKEVRYRVHLEDGDPAKVFAVGPTQAIKPIDAHTAEITVYAIRPDRKDGNRNAPADPPTKDDPQPNNLIQSDDPLIVSDAKKAAGGEKDPWRAALLLESYVNHEMKMNRNYSQAFASASEVARSLEGDCTEHGVFLAALARARGIPARVAIGLIYVEDKEGKPAFFYHLWTEVSIEGRWIPIDGTLALGGIGADHLKIAQSNLKGASAYSAFVPVLQVAGQLRIEIVDAK
jgi:hypothetical protein